LHIDNPSSLHHPTRCEVFHPPSIDEEGNRVPSDHDKCCRPSHLCWGSRIDNGEDVKTNADLQVLLPLWKEYVKKQCLPTTRQVQIVRAGLDEMARLIDRHLVEAAAHTRKHSRQLSDTLPIRTVVEETNQSGDDESSVEVAAQLTFDKLNDDPEAHPLATESTTAKPTVAKPMDAKKAAKKAAPKSAKNG
jgi:hypothetical protein